MSAFTLQYDFSLSAMILVHYLLQRTPSALKTWVENGQSSIQQIQGCSKICYVHLTACLLKTTVKELNIHNYFKYSIYT